MLAGTLAASAQQTGCRKGESLRTSWSANLTARSSTPGTRASGLGQTLPQSSRCLACLVDKESYGTESGDRRIANTGKGDRWAIDASIALILYSMGFYICKV